MTPLFKKLNWKGHDPVWVSRAPAEFRPEMEAMAEHCRFAELPEPCGFAIGFLMSLADVEAYARLAAEHVAGDGLIWACYPKGSSKRHKCGFNRDSGWAAFGDLGFEPVRQVAIDADWSALRFRRVEFIKTMTRSFAMTEEGKRKATPPNKAAG
jgi:hypothetical protein